VRALIDDVATRLAPVSWTVYKHAVPVAPVARYLFVYSGTGLGSSDVLSDVQRVRDVVLWVSAVSLNTNPQSAALEAAWGAEKAQARLLDWRPTTGELAFPATHLSSAPPRRDDELPSTVAYVATDSYLFIVQPGS
jgi:hypothetical protein